MAGSTLQIAKSDFIVVVDSPCVRQDGISGRKVVIEEILGQTDLVVAVELEKAHGRSGVARVTHTHLQQNIIQTIGVARTADHCEIHHV